MDRAWLNFMLVLASIVSLIYGFKAKLGKKRPFVIAAIIYVIQIFESFNCETWRCLRNIVTPELALRYLQKYKIDKP
jgi:hypothetical protein